ncbi:hypothetical protein GCM10023322_76250 [Rugosimonospora acidiphila]|uniref:Uncharacterized protein n=1 Tax=Rugosimonospora acidiphila TaxID=556531 RepID=A0ABP9SRH8_9ACTN
MTNMTADAGDPFIFAGAGTASNDHLQASLISQARHPTADVNESAEGERRPAGSLARHDVRARSTAAARLANS